MAQAALPGSEIRIFENSALRRLLVGNGREPGFQKRRLWQNPRKIFIKEVWFIDHVSELRDCIIGMAEMAILRYRSVTAELKGR